MRKRTFLLLIAALILACGLVGAQFVGSATYTQPLYGSYENVPTADGTANVVQRDVVGNKTDAAAAGAVSTTESLMAYIKQIVGGQITVDSLQDVPTKDAVTNLYIRDVVGIKTDSAAAGAVSETESLVAYAKQNVGANIVIDGLMDVPIADAVTNLYMRDVVGIKTDAAAAGAVSATESLMAYAKQLITDDLRSNGQNGLTWYVDANIGASGAGTSWTAAFKTMAEAFAVIGSGDTIRFRGKILEQLTTPAQVFDVTVIGAGNRPRHADSTPAGGEEATNSWTEPAEEAAATPLVKVQQQGWRFENILFYGGDDNSCIQFFRDGSSGDDERDGSHGEVIGCKFASGYDGIEDSGGTSNVLIKDCVIASMTNYALKHTTGAGIGNLLDWRIKDNDFYLNANWMGAWGSNGAIITGNTVINTTTLLIDTSSGTRNTVVGNVFNIAAASFDPDGNVTGDATDVWSNTLLDGIETGLPAN